MSNVRSSLNGAGSVFAAPITATSQTFLQRRAPSVGDKVKFKDGREFVFCSSAVDVAQGLGVGMAAPATTLTTIGAASAAGSFTITLAAGVVTANAYADGYAHVVADAGLGKTYRIKSNTAGTASAGAVLTLYDPIIVALTTASDLTITMNPFNLVVLATDVTVFIGVPTQIVTAATDGVTQYFWVQTKGACTMQQTGNVTKGNVLSVDGSGTAITNAAHATQKIGVCMLASTTADCAIWLYGNGLD